MAMSISKNSYKKDAVSSAESETKADNLGPAAETASDVATEMSGKDIIGHRVSGVLGIEGHMDVLASCGKKIGVVDGVEENALKLTRQDSPDSLHHYVPISWISRVDDRVHLIKNSEETVEGWQSSASSCGCG